MIDSTNLENEEIILPIVGLTISRKICGRRNRDTETFRRRFYFHVRRFRNLQKKKKKKGKKKRQLITLKLKTSNVFTVSRRILDISGTHHQSQHCRSNFRKMPARRWNKNPPHIFATVPEAAIPMYIANRGGNEIDCAIPHKFHGVSTVSALALLRLSKVRNFYEARAPIYDTHARTNTRRGACSPRQTPLSILKIVFWHGANRQSSLSRPMLAKLRIDA